MQRNTLPAGSLQKDSLNKYKKNKKSSPSIQNDASKTGSSENQFKKYLLDATNVFYEDRDSLKQLESKARTLWVGVPIWVFLAVTYLLIGSIKPYQGICPSNATCKVFLRCNPGYELTQNGRQCQIQKRIVEEVESVCQFQVEKLRRAYGDLDCQEEKPYQTPSKYVFELTDSMVKGQPPDITAAIKTKIHNYLTNETNQFEQHFSVQKQIIVPTKKLHSFNCALTLYTQTLSFKFLVVGVVLFLIISGAVVNMILTISKAKKIYAYLKEKTVKEGNVNVTLLNDEIKAMFGGLNEDMWTRVEEIRKSQGKIGYYEEDFLYWQLL